MFTVNTSFKDWLLYVFRKGDSSQDIAAELVLKNLPEGHQDFRSLDVYFISIRGGELYDTFTDLWNQYSDYLDYEYSTRSRTLDVCTVKVKDLVKGYSLWHCVNAAGDEYSYIRDADGFEIMSNVRNLEPKLLAVFNERVKKGIC